MVQPLTQPAAEPVIHVAALTKRFRGETQPVLRSLDLSIPPGSVTGLLGRNAAGKTTLLKCLLGLLRLTSGSARIWSEDSWDLSDTAKARIGYVPQEIALYPWMRVRQVIDYTAAFYPLWNRDLVSRLIREWDLPEKSLTSTLSTGQTQKVATLLAMGHEPDLLILDEPVAALDPASRRDFLRALLEVASDGSRTILFSTHITSDLERVADHVAVLRDGRVACHDALDSLKDRVKRIRLTAPTPFPQASPDLPGVHLLRYAADNSSALLAVDDFDDSLPALLAQRFSAHVRVEDLNLEEIFLELHGIPESPDA